MFDKHNHGKTALLIAVILSICIFFYQKNQLPTKLTYKGKTVEISKHAACRMECREIDFSDVHTILKKGQRNTNKSNPNAPDCPRFALEGATKNKESVRVIIADCEEVVTLVTVIDLKNRYDCNCK